MGEMKKQKNAAANFSDYVVKGAAKKGMLQADLVQKSLLSKTTISRIFRDSTDKGTTYQPTLPVVWAISIGLALNRDEAKELLFLAFPAFELWGCFLDKGLSIYDVNSTLYDAGLPLWGNMKE